MDRPSLYLWIVLCGCAGGEGSCSTPVDSAPGTGDSAERANALAEPSVATPPETQPPEPDPRPEIGDEPADPATETGTDADLAALLALDGSGSTSIGGPRDGRIEGAIALPASGPGFRQNPRRPNREARFGTVEMVQALVLASAVVNEELPGGRVTINDLGLPGGGPIAHHGSHRAGRDVDVLFYALDREGQPTPAVGAFLDARGRGFDFRALDDPRDDHLVRIDLPRTWRWIQALLEGRHADLVQRIFVVEHLRTLLLRQADRAQAPRAIRDRFAQITCQPGYPHDDHLHIRFYCTAEDQAAGCEDSGPTYRWRRLQLRASGLRPVINRPRRDRPSAPTTSAAEARVAAGALHARVQEWLARREAWAAQPHPGRPFCR